MEGVDAVEGRLQCLETGQISAPLPQVGRRAWDVPSYQPWRPHSPPLVLAWLNLPDNCQTKKWDEEREDLVAGSETQKHLLAVTARAERERGQLCVRQLLTTPIQ